MAAGRWTRTSVGVLFALYATGLLIWLTLGLLPTLSAILPSVRHVLESVAMQGGALGTAADRIMSADMSMSTMSMSTAGVLLQYGFSALNFGLGLMLAIRRPHEPVPRLLAFALLGTAATFNMPSHRAFYITGSPWPIAAIHFTFNAPIWGIRHQGSPPFTSSNAWFRRRSASSGYDPGVLCDVMVLEPSSRSLGCDD